MITAAALDALPPAQRAALIYGEAQAELSQRLWQAALGTQAPTSRGAGAWDGVPLDGAALHNRRPMPGGAGDQDSELDALLTLLAREYGTKRAPPRTDTSGPPAFAPSKPVRDEAVLPRPAASSGPVAGGPCVFGANARYSACIEAAAARTGIPPAALAAIVDAEAGKTSDGGWKLYSRNPRSSAAGLGQFLNRTWQGMAETPGTWLNQQARAQGWLEGGRVQAHARGALLAMRYDPTAAINGVADYARRNLDGLKRAGIGADDTRATARLAYLGHHLGLGDAIRFLRDGGLSETRAKTLLDAQVGSHASTRRIAQSGDATRAHRDWMLAYLDHQVRPERFASQPWAAIG